MKAERNLRGKSTLVLWLSAISCSIHITPMITSFTCFQLENTLSCPQFVEQGQEIQPDPAKGLGPSQPRVPLGLCHQPPTNFGKLPCIFSTWSQIHSSQCQSNRATPTGAALDLILPKSGCRHRWREVLQNTPKELPLGYGENIILFLPQNRLCT